MVLVLLLPSSSLVNGNIQKVPVAFLLLGKLYLQKWGMEQKRKHGEVSDGPESL